MGLVNKVVPHDQLDAEVDQWCKEINEMSPTALTIVKRSFPADTEHIRGISFQGIQTVKHYTRPKSRRKACAHHERRQGPTSRSTSADGSCDERCDSQRARRRRRARRNHRHAGQDDECLLRSS